MTLDHRLRVGLYVDGPKATTLRFVRCLQTWRMSYRSIWRDELSDLAPDDVDVLLLHGGWYGIDRIPGQNQDDLQTTPERQAAGDAIRRYVEAGGGIVGVCCGAFNIVWLGLIEARISRSAGVGPHELEVVNGDHPIARGVARRAEGRTDRQWLRVPTIRVNGPILFPEDAATMLFSYDWEQRLGAVLAGDYGQGRAVAISPHPERTEHDLGDDALLTEPLMPVARLLHNALFWAAGRDVPASDEGETL